SFLRVQYDDNSWKEFLKIIPKLDKETQSVALSDAWFFTQKGVYSWPKFLNLVHALKWDKCLMQWSAAVPFMDTLYHRFRYHREWAKVKQFLASLGEDAYNRIGKSSSEDWETPIPPDYRRSMYCYGLKKVPYKLGFVENLRKYFEKEAFYYDRDGDNLLRAMTCANLTHELSR
ncbi:hypothetical protein OESDEN_18580, partial [Oesophagostomum dentatum]